MKIFASGILLFASVLPASAEFLSIDRIIPFAERDGAANVPGTLAVPIPTDIEYGANIRLGQGFDVFKNEFSKEADCIAAVRADSEAAKDKISQANRKHVNFVTDMSSHESASSSSAGFSLTYKLLTVGASSGVNSDSYFNTIDEYARIYRRIVTRISSRVGGDWGPGAKPIVDRGLRHGAVMTRFTEVCGTHYVSSIYYGHVIDETLRFRLFDEKRTKADKKTFSAGVKELFSASYDEKQAEVDVRKTSSVEHHSGSQGIIAAGAPDVTAAGGVRAMVKYATVDFDDAVLKLQPDDSAAIAFELSPYYSLNISQQNYLPRTDEILYAMSERMDLFELLLTNVSQLKFALHDITEVARTAFYKETLDEMQKKLDLAQGYVDEYRDVVQKRCVDRINADVSEDRLKECEDAIRKNLTAKMINDTRVARADP